jgi:AraC-like DNA-binding protein/mannose-6-phosphate isomerase-like protein (cupin superfamily)
MEVRWNDEVADALEADGFTARSMQRVRRTKLHRQPGIELHWLARGRGSMLVGDSRHAVTPGELLVFDAELPHEVVASGGEAVERLVVCLSPRWARRSRLDRLLGDVPLRIYRPPEETLRRLTGLTCTLRKEEVHRGVAWRTMSSGLILQLAAVLRRGRRTTPITEAEVSDLARLASEYVQTHLSDPPTLSRVAEHFRVSNEHLTRVFTSEFGQPFMRYVLRQRIEHACDLLRRQPPLSVTDVAYRLGFASHSAFTRAFTRTTGSSPTVWRERRSVVEDG